MNQTALKKRLIPKLLIKHRQVGRYSRPVLVTTRGFRNVLDIGDAVSQAKIYEAQLADELVVLNIDRHRIEGDDALLDLIERLASETFMPLGVGGGVRSIADFECLLGHGADKVIVNSAALDDLQLVRDAAGQFGSQCVVVSIDFRNVNGSHFVFRNCASEQTSHDVLGWARLAVEAGAGELLLTDADRDGGGAGLNVQVCSQVAAAVDVPVILSGGCGLAEHFVEGFLHGNAEAVSAGTFFCFRDQNPIQTRAHIRNAGIPIRVVT